MNFVKLSGVTNFAMSATIGLRLIFLIICSISMIYFFTQDFFNITHDYFLQMNL